MSKDIFGQINGPRRKQIEIKSRRTLKLTYDQMFTILNWHLRAFSDSWHLLDVKKVVVGNPFIRL